MTKIRLYSEPFAKTGNIAAEGFKKLLGRPALGLMQTLIREALQNVLDATQSVSGPRVLIRLRTLNAEQKQTLHENIFAERPCEGSASEDIDSSLAKSEIRVLEICDFGTEGLSGPTTADAPHDGTDAPNFINFLRNVGSVRDTHQGAGTYGYGKSSLYAMSRCSTIIVDSQTRCAGRDERRFMACHLGIAFDATTANGKRRRFTGRHWWGIHDEPDYVKPIINDDAINWSLALGMPARERNQKGTSILILDPDVPDEDLQSVADDIIETVLWNFWPRMIDSTPANRKLKVEVEFEGQLVTVPKPEQFPPLDLFAAAMDSHRKKSKDLEPIGCRNPKKFLGNLALHNGLRADRVVPALRENSIIPKQSSHIALMRPVELVVRYLEGVPLPDHRFDWAGVFICSDDDVVEEAFATAEPPAHDDWIPDNLPKGAQKTFVNVALKRLKEIARPQTGATNLSAVLGQRGESLAATATKLGEFLGDVSSKGPGKVRQTSHGRSTRKTTRVSLPRFDGLALNDKGYPVARFVADLQNDGTNQDLYLIAEPHLVADGSAISSDDLSEIYDLRVDGMTVGGLSMSEQGSWIHVADKDGEVIVTVPTVPDAAIGIKLYLQSGSPT